MWILLFKIISRTSAVSLTNLGSILVLIFESRLVDTCNILCGWVFSLWEGSYFFFFFFNDNRSHKKVILSLCQVGVPSKHAQNEDEKRFNRNTSIKRNINGRIRAICMQDSGPPGYQNNQFKQRRGVQRKTTWQYVELRLARLEHNNQSWKKVWN